MSQATPPPIRRQISTKITVAYAVLSLFISGALAFALYYQIHRQQEEAIEGRLTDILNFSIPLVNGSVHALIRADTPTNNPSYRLMSATLADIQNSSPIIRDVFTIQQKADGHYIYLVDNAEAERKAFEPGVPFANPIQLKGRVDTTTPIIETKLIDRNGEKLLRGYIPIIDEFNQFNGLLVVDIDAHTIESNQRRAAGIAIFTFLLTSPLAILIGWFISKTLLSPINELTKATQRITSGEFKQLVPIRSQDELGLLAYTFNNMMSELNNAYSTLEQRVRDRTIQLVEARKAAESASNAKSQFLSNMSHELRTPLNVIIGYSNAIPNRPAMFNNEPLAEVYLPYIRLIEENGHYLLGLIDDILDLSKIEAGKLELHLTAVDLPNLLKGVVATSIGLLKDKPVQIQLQLPDHLPKIWADPMRFRQIILNLMSNAIKFTHSGTVTIAARIQAQFVSISVIDTGIGIPEAALQSIFDRFAQVEQRTGKYGGTGLGLDISKQLALMHGGDLVVSSTVNQGSTFTVHAPIATLEQIEKAKKIEFTETERLTFFSEPAPEITTSQSDEMRIVLLVEDDTAMRDLVHRLLENINYVVVDIADGIKAYEMANTLQPDLIILDAQLPTKSGWEVLMELKSDPATALLPVIFYTSDIDKNRLKQQGVTHVLQKPFSPQQLIELVQQVTALEAI
ncbi:MAG: response regulator [Chloroflexi bacterium]|nr:response regulator [Chloroflexota bacterium]